MGNVYKSAFLIPASTTKRLGDAGWEFESNERLPRGLLLALERGLSLKSGKSYLGMEILEGDGIKFTISCDSVGGIENIFIQFHTRGIDELRQILADAAFDKVDLFVPTRKA